MTRLSQTDSSFLFADRERLFLLPTMMLPGGLQRLKVIEARYLDLVADALKLQNNVVIAFDTEGSNQPYQWGICGQIVNFDRSDKGFLLVDVEAVAVVALTNVSKNERGEWIANTHYVSHWTMINTTADATKFAAVLHRLFKSYPQISALYGSHYFDNIEWVCARLIELLPLPDDAKKIFLKPDSFQLVVSFLDTIIEENYDYSDLNSD